MNGAVRTSSIVLAGAGAGALIVHVLLLAVGGREWQTENLFPFLVGASVAAFGSWVRLTRTTQARRTLLAVAAACLSVPSVYVLWLAGVAVGFYDVDLDFL